ncbi:MAG: NAD(P)H-dependent glycerol-3-phosphate dehydrogenase [Chloroflexota bacterium]
MQQVIGMIGLGNFGTAMANLIAAGGHRVLAWEYDADVVTEINTQHTNSRYLAGHTLSKNLHATTDLRDVFVQCRVVFVGIPTTYIQPTLAPVKRDMDENTLLVNMAKGIHTATGLTAYGTLRHMFPHNPAVILSGPSIANEFAAGMPTLVVIAGQNPNDLMRVAQLIDTETFRVRFSSDEIGVEWGGILKNIYAIGLGLFDGAGVDSVNFRAVYLTLAIEEMARIGSGLGAQVETFLSFTGTGDLLATALSPHSHNRHLGERLAQGASVEAIKAEMGVLPEGYNALRGVLYRAEKHRIAVPVARSLWEVIQGEATAQEFINSLLRDFTD